MSGDLSQLMAKAQEAQQKLQALQQELVNRRVEGSSGGGMVKASVSGGMRVLSIEIEPQLVDSGDRDMLQDLVAAAVNAALGNAQRMIQEEMQRASASFNIPIQPPPAGE
jgi:DNA-binding YbaB/EbfC family protein